MILSKMTHGTFEKYLKMLVLLFRCGITIMRCPTRCPVFATVSIVFSGNTTRTKSPCWCKQYGKHRVNLRCLQNRHLILLCGVTTHFPACLLMELKMGQTQWADPWEQRPVWLDASGNWASRAGFGLLTFIGKWLSETRLIKNLLSVVQNGGNMYQPTALCAQFSTKMS